MGADYQKIQKLKGAENYLQWEVAIRIALIVNKLFKVVKPTFTPPTRTEDTDLEREEGKEKGLSYEDYVELDEQALAAIQMTCEPGPYQQIYEIKTSKEAWAKLKECYGANTYATMESALFSIITIKADNYKDLNEYLSEFQRLTGKLALTGDVLTNNMQAAFFKKGLPEYLAPYTFSIYEDFRKEKKDINFDYLVAALLDREISKKEDAKAYEAGNFGKQSKPDKNRGGKGSNKASKETCKDCPNRSRHLAKECWNKYPDKKPEFLEKKEEKNKDSSSKQTVYEKQSNIRP